MKIKNLFIAMMVFAGAITFNSCVDDNDYSIPKIEIKDSGLKANKTIADIKAMYSGSVVDFTGKDYIIEGYVTSSDEAGNFFKEIYIQDKPENPTSAVQIGVEEAGLSSRYEVGRKVLIKLDGLAMGNDRGMLKIGKLGKSKKGYDTFMISSTDYKKVIINTTEKVEIVPVLMSIEDAKKEENLGKFIKLDDVRSKDKGVNYTNEADKDYHGTNREIENCKGETIIMRNSTHASFANEPMPAGRGSVQGVLGIYKTSSKTEYQLKIRDTEDVSFTKPYDCDGTDVNTDNTTDNSGNGNNNNNGGNTDNGGTDNSSTAVKLAPGSDFEDMDAFKAILNQYGLSKSVSPVAEGRNGGTALKVSGTFDRNTYLFTIANKKDNSIAGKKKISFYIKGTAVGKSLGIIVHKESETTASNGKTYQDNYVFRLGDVDGSKTEVNIPSPLDDPMKLYAGSIDTKGQWVKVTIDISSLTGLATSADKSILAIKAGKKAKWDLLIDDIMIE